MVERNSMKNKENDDSTKVIDAWLEMWARPNVKGKHFGKEKIYYPYSKNVFIKYKNP